MALPACRAASTRRRTKSATMPPLRSHGGWRRHRRGSDGIGACFSRPLRSPRKCRATPGPVSAFFSPCSSFAPRETAGGAGRGDGGKVALRRGDAAVRATTAALHAEIVLRAAHSSAWFKSPHAYVLLLRGLAHVPPRRPRSPAWEPIAISDMVFVDILASGHVGHRGRPRRGVLAAIAWHTLMERAGNGHPVPMMDYEPEERRGETATEGLVGQFVGLVAP